MQKIDITKIQPVLKEFKDRKGALIPILQKVQEIYGYLPKPVLEEISKQTKIPISKIYGVVTFYAQFYLTPRGKNIIRVCKGPTCNINGGKEIRNHLKRMISKKANRNLKFTMEEVSCLGDCDKSPVLMINSETFEKLNREKVRKILRGYKWKRR